VINWYQLPVLQDDGRWETPKTPSLLSSLPHVADNSAMDVKPRRPSKMRAVVTLLVVVTLAGVGLAGAIGLAVGILALVLRQAAG
jgi:hypothetical protein